MPSKTSKDGRPYEIDGKRLTWHPEDDDGERGSLPDITIPMRLKLGLILDLAERELDTQVMVEMLNHIIPNQADTLREMDVNDFQDMFSTWQIEYNGLTGASLGEASASAG